MARLDIVQIPVLSDNYVYLVHDREQGATAVIDPAVAPPVLAALAERDWTLTHILNTHHHPDHVGGNLALKEATGAVIVGNANDADRLPGIDRRVHDGDRVTLGAASAQVIDVPGHTSGHIAYWFEDDAALFCGDTIFALGCGRLFEGSPRDMWTSLKKLRRLPDRTRVYCAHEYTQANARFAQTIDPHNAQLASRRQTIDDLRRRGLPTVPSFLGEEKATNPFLRADAAELQAALSMQDSEPEDVFAVIRHRKDVF